MNTASIFKKLSLLTLSFSLMVGIFAMKPLPALAAASMYISAPSTAAPGNNITISVYVNTGGASANSFDGTISYPANLFDGVRGSYSGSVCTLQVTQADPNNGSANFTCGTPAGFTGTGMVVYIVLQAKAAGSGSIGLSGCQVLANDGRGTNITGGCSGSSITVSGSSNTSTPPPNATPPPPQTPPPSTGGSTTSTPKPTVKPTTAPAKASPTPTPSSNVKQDTKPAENPQPAPADGTTPTPPPTQPLSETNKSTNPAGPAEAKPSEAPAAAEASQKRTIITAFQDFLSSLKELKSLPKDVSGLIIVLISLLPLLGIILAILFFLYRLYLMERRRKRTLDRLFELELSELAALEGKLDLLADKGTKGREQYREEFKQAKENILRQIRPDYGKPVDPPATK